MAKKLFSLEESRAFASFSSDANPIHIDAGGARRLLITDLDDTLWGNSVGEVGSHGIRLGGHDHEGEAFVEFQRCLKDLTNRGIMLGIVSKNDEDVALKVFETHPEMVLKKDDFIGWRINWTDKAENVADLTREANLGLGSVVFIDDSPIERARVREALADVLVPDWPDDPCQYSRALLGLRCFDTPGMSDEDRGRSRLQTADEWLKTLDVIVSMELLTRPNLPRATKLLNKTNQLNLSTRRLSEAELWDWANQDNHAVLTFRMKDRFGDLGLTGLVSLSNEGKQVRIVDYLLSCRVMGRKVEETMVHAAVSQAQKWNAEKIVAEYVATERNAPCLRFWKNSGLQKASGITFYWDSTKSFPLPDCVTLISSIAE